MDTPAAATAPAEDTLELVVSTWHISHLHGGQPEGLPTDLLSKNSALFYIVDRVVCDASGFAGEMKWQDYWLSAAIYYWLREAQLIREIDLNSSDVLPKPPADFWKDLQDSAEGQQAVRAMERAYKEARGPHPPTQLDPGLAALNHKIFLSLNVPNSLPYDYQDFHFVQHDGGQAAERAETDQQIWGVSLAEREARDRRLKLLLHALVEFFPNPELLPPMTTVDAREALNANVAQEGSWLIRVICGDPDPHMKHENFEDFRRSSRFARNDALVDDPRRWDMAWRNFDRLMEVRDQTRDLRKQLQRLILKITDPNPIDNPSDLVDSRGETPGLREAHDLLNKQLRQMRAHMPIGRSPLQRVTGNPSIGLLMALIDNCIGPYLPAIPGFGPIGVGIASGLYGTYDWKVKQPALRRRLAQEKREKLWLATFNDDLERVLLKGFGGR